MAFRIKDHKTKTGIVHEKTYVNIARVEIFVKENVVKVELHVYGSIDLRVGGYEPVEIITHSFRQKDATELQLQFSTKSGGPLKLIYEKLATYPFWNEETVDNLFEEMNGALDGYEENEEISLEIARVNGYVEGQHYTQKVISLIENL